LVAATDVRGHDLQDDGVRKLVMLVLKLREIDLLNRNFLRSKIYDAAILFGTLRVFCLSIAA